MQGIFEFLFKYRPLLFQEGDLAFASPWQAMAVLGVVAAVAIPAVLTYAVARGDTTRTDRAVMACLRLGTIAVLVFILFQPVLVLTSVVPQRNFVGILFDDSQSMQITGTDGVPRSDFVQRTFGAEGSELLTRLNDKFTLRFFRFGRSLDRLRNVSELTYEGTGTVLGEAMVHAQQELAGLPLSGLVLISDGADNSGQILAESLLPLQAAKVPVYTVGLGDEALSPDIQVSRVEVPRSTLKGTTLVVDVTISHRGYSETTVPLLVEDAGQVMAAEDVVLGGDGEPVVARVRLEAEESSPRIFQFRVPIQDGERVARNNVREVLIDVVDETEKILYFEGEPRWEVKFLRRAVADDENLQVVVLQRTAESKFLRLDVDDAEELAGGFPKTREELFRYRAMILGSVEASFFTQDQLNMIADFVSQRGGGLLALGGRNSFREGGYEGTPLAEAFPVFLDTEISGEQPFFAELHVSPTRTGLTHPAIQLGGRGGDDVTELWESLPPVTSLNPITRVKPGATDLLTGGSEVDRTSQVVLAYHRYGRGKVIVLPIQDSWTWQMHADIAPEDQTHETFWRQLLRWLTDGVPHRVAARSEWEVVEPGEVVDLSAFVSDSAYVEVNNSSVVATILSPGDDTLDVPLDWAADEDGRYDATFKASEPGLYEISVQATRAMDTLGAARTYVRAAPSVAEYFDASMRGVALRRIAEETGGLFYTPASVSSLPEDISLTGAGVTLTEQRDLWDMPILLVVLLSLIGAEWSYRRMRNLV